MFPVLFRIYGFEIRSYGVFLAAGILAGVYFASKEIRRKNLPEGLMVEFIPFGVGLGLIFSRAAYVATHFSYFYERPLQTFNFRAGGLNFSGALIGGITAAVIFLRRKKIPFRKFADSSAPALSVALFFGRIGCFLNGCCYGTRTQLPWSVVYTDPHSSALLHTTLHPVQLYEAAANLVIFAFLWRIRKRTTADGKLFYIFLILYSGTRLFLERFRADTLALITPNFAWTDAFFLGIILIGAALFFTAKEGDAKCPKEQKRHPKGQRNTPRPKDSS